MTDTAQTIHKEATVLANRVREYRQVIKPELLAVDQTRLVVNELKQVKFFLNRDDEEDLIQARLHLEDAKKWMPVIR